MAANTGYIVDLLIEEKVLAMELDTGALISIISEETWKATFHSTSLELSRVQMKTYSGEDLGVLGQRLVRVQYGAQAKLEVEPGAKPQFHQSRSAPMH